MASKWMEPGGDGDFNTGFWNTVTGAAVATDFVHVPHIKSIKFRANTGDNVLKTNVVSDAGGRASVYIYLNALPGGTISVPIVLNQSGVGNTIVGVNITSAGVLQLLDNNAAQIGSNGASLVAGTWYRLCLAWKITSSTVNEFRLFKDGSQTITASNVTLPITTMADFVVGNVNTDLTMDLRASDIYLDNSIALTDIGNVWVTAKRPNANGTTNGFTTQIGAGGSGYGTGHSPQVNERPLNQANGWSIATAGSAITEEYNIESASQGDIDITGATIIDYMGWVVTKALIAETGKIIVNNVQSNISIPTGASFLFAFAGSTTYPAGTGTDIGEITSTTVTTVSLYECGILVAYIPAVATTPTNQGYFQRMGFFG